MGKHNALGKSLEEIVEEKKREFVAGASSVSHTPREHEVRQKLKRVEERLQQYQIAYEEEVQFREHDQKYWRRQLRMISSKAGAFRRWMCAGLFCWWLCGIVMGIMALTTSLDPLDKWLQISLGVAVMITSAWLWTVVYTHETFAETAGRMECEDDHND